MTPSPALDGGGGILLLLRDQRSASPELRPLDENNGDVFASELVDLDS